MTKDKLLPLSISLVGVGGFFLNRLISTTAVDPDTFLLLPSSYPTALFGLTAVVAVVLLLILASYSAPSGLAALFRAPGQLSNVLWLSGGLLLLFGGALTGYQILHTIHTVGLSIPLVLCAVLNVIAGVSQLVVYKYLSQNIWSDSLPMMTVFPSLAALPWLLYCYQENTRNPVITLYAFELLAFSTIAFALYLVSTAAYGKTYYRTCLFLSLFGAYLSITALSAGNALGYTITLMAFSLILLGNGSAMLNVASPIGRRIAPQQNHHQEGTE